MFQGRCFIVQVHMYNTTVDKKWKAQLTEDQIEINFDQLAVHVIKNNRLAVGIKNLLDRQAGR